MPSRIIRDTLTSSDSLGNCSPAAQDRVERYWLACDDLGCFDYDGIVLKGSLYPRRPDMTPEQIEADLAEYVRWGMVEVWTARGRRYGFWKNWHRHNRRRPDAKLKRPLPP
ncbi:MAG: hypothetical protein Q8S13_14140, partial [Dehalococcoidia bacterium]|nr:hypothetical protein [Dehalococcoidia bacterium]